MLLDSFCNGSDVSSMSDWTFWDMYCIVFLTITWHELVDYYFLMWSVWGTSSSPRWNGYHFQFFIFLSCVGHWILEQHWVESCGRFLQRHVPENCGKCVHARLSFTKMLRIWPWRPEKLRYYISAILLSSQNFL